MESLTKRLKRKDEELGTTVVGVADASLYGEAPEGHKAEDILRGASSVISLGFLQPKTIIEKAMPTQYTRNIFTVASIADHVANLLALWLEKEGYEAIPVSARGMYMDALAGELRGDLSHKHTAVFVGLGEIGMNSLLLSPEFGNRSMISSVVVNAPLIPDRPFSEKPCLREKCLKCVQVCPVKAISPVSGVEKIKCARYYRAHTDIYFETWGLILLPRMPPSVSGGSPSEKS